MRSLVVEMVLTAHLQERAAQGYLAHKNPHPPLDPTVGLYLGSYGGPRGGALFLMNEVALYLNTPEGRVGGQT